EGAGFGLRFWERTAWSRSATVFTSSGFIIHAVMETDVAPESAVEPRPPRPPPLPPSAILGLVVANSSETSSPVMCSFAGSQEIVRPGLLLDRPVGSRTAVFTLSIVPTRLAILSSQESHVFHSPG